MVKFKNLFFGDDSLNIVENSKNNENVTIGLKYKMRSKPPIIGKNALIRSNSIVYNDVEIGNNFKTGHGVTIREKTTIGNDVLVGTNTVIEGHCTIGNNVSIQSNVYIPTNTIIEDYVFIGPCACFTNDKYPIRVDFNLKGPVIKRGASIGANSTFLSNIEIGEGCNGRCWCHSHYGCSRLFPCYRSSCKNKTTPQTPKKIEQNRLKN